MHIETSNASLATHTRLIEIIDRIVETSPDVVTVTVTERDERPAIVKISDAVIGLFGGSKSNYGYYRRYRYLFQM